MKHATSCALFAAMTLLAAIISTSSAQNTSAIGGSSGTAFTAKCLEGEVLLGVKGWKGSWIDLAQGICGKVSLINGSTVWGSNTSEAGTKPLFAVNADYYSFCGHGYAVKGFSGTAGSYVNTLKLVCEKLGAGARTQGSSKALAVVGGAGGTAHGPYSCPESKPAIGFYGRAGNYVDKFGLICGYILPAVPVLLTPLKNAQVTTRRPRFDWDPAARVTKPYRICINLSTSAGCEISNTVTATTATGTTEWMPYTDLPFARGDVVYWRVEACNENDCKYATRSFTFMPPQ